MEILVEKINSTESSQKLARLESSQLSFQQDLSQVLTKHTPLMQESLEAVERLEKLENLRLYLTAVQQVHLYQFELYTLT